VKRSAVPERQKGPFINTRELVTSAGLDPATMGEVEPLEVPAARSASRNT